MHDGGSAAIESGTDVEVPDAISSGRLDAKRGTWSRFIAIAVVAIMVASSIAVVSFTDSNGTPTSDEDHNADTEVNGSYRKVNFEISHLGESYLKPTDYAKLGRSDHTKPGINQWYVDRSTIYNDTIIHNSWPYAIASDPYSGNLYMPPTYPRTSWVTNMFYQLKVDADNVTGLATGAQMDPWMVPIFHTGTDPDADNGGWVNMSLYQNYITSQEYADIKAGVHYANTFYGVPAAEYSANWQYYESDGWFSEIQGHWDFNRNAAHKFLGLPGGADLVAEYNAVGSAALAAKWRAEWIADGDIGGPLDIYSAYDYSLLSGNGPVTIWIKLDAANSNANKIAIWFWSQTWGGEVLFMRYLEKVGIEKNLMPQREDWYLNATFGPVNGDLHERMTTTYHATAWADKQAYNNPTWMLEAQHMDYTADRYTDQYKSRFDPYAAGYYGSGYMPTRMNYNPGVASYGQRVHYWQTPMNWNLSADETLSIKLPSSSQLGWGLRPYWSNNYSLPGNAATELQANGRTGEFVLGHGYPSSLYSSVYYNPATRSITIPGGTSFAPNMNPIAGYTSLFESGSPQFFFDISPVSHYNLELLGTGNYTTGQPYILRVTPLDLNNVPVMCNQTVQLPAVLGATYGASSHTFLPSESSWSTTVTFSVPNTNYTLISQDAYFYLDISDSKRVYVGGGPANSPPTVDIAGQFTVVKRVTNTYTVTASDPDNDPLKYTWSWGDNSVAVTYTNSATHAYAKRGVYTLTVAVDDQTGLPGHVVSDSAIVTVLDSLPAPSKTVSFGFPGFPVYLNVSSPADFLLEALDVNGVVSTSYRGKVAFMSTDPVAVLPSQYSFTKSDAGQHWFMGGQLVFHTPGIQVLRAYDVNNPSISGNVTVTIVDARVTLLDERFDSWSSLERHWSVWNSTDPVYNNIDVVNGTLQMTDLYANPVIDAYNAMANWTYPMTYYSNLTISFKVYLPQDEYYKEGIYGQFVAIGLYDTSGVERLFARFLMDIWAGAPNGFTYANQYSTWSRIAGFSAGWHNCSISLQKGASTWVASFDGVVYGGLSFSNSVWSASDLSKIVIYNALREEPVVSMVDFFKVARVGPPTTPPGPNTPPVADFVIYPPSGTPSTYFSFNGTVSYDKEDPLSALKFRWDWEGNGIWDTVWLPNPIVYHLYGGAGGVYYPAMEVMDTGGLKGFANHTLIVDANPPFCDAGPDVLAYHGAPVTLSAIGSFDPETEIVEYTWSYTDYYGTHFLSGRDVTVTMLYYTHQRVPVTLTVWDAAGNGASDTCTVTIWPYRETVLKFPEHNSYTTLFYQAPDNGDWTIFMENQGLKSIGIVVYEQYNDNQTLPTVILKETVRFQSYGAFPYGTVYLPTLQMKRGLTYRIDATPTGTTGTSADFGSEFVSSNHAPVAGMTYTVNDMTVTVDASLSYDPDGDPVRFTWDWRDGARSYGTTATHTFAAYGMYIVVLRVTDDTGFVSLTSEHIAITIPPVAVITVVSVSGLTVYVDGSSSYDPDGVIQWYSWTWWDGTPPTLPSTVPTASHTYAAAGTYSIRLQVFDNMGASATAFRSVTVQQLPEPPFSVFGYTLDSYGDPLPGCNVTVTNLRTGASQSNASDEPFGWFYFDLSTFEFGWQVGDIIRVTAWKDTVNGTRDVMLTSEIAEQWFVQIDVLLRSGGGPPFPYLICGFTNDSLGVPIFGCSVTVTDLRTGISLVTVSDTPPGWYQVDISQIPGGWAVGDTIRVTATNGALSGSSDVVLIDSAVGFVVVNVTLS